MDVPRGCTHLAFILSLAAIAFLSILASASCSSSLDTGSLDLETDFDGKNFLDIFLGWGKSVKMRKDMWVVVYPFPSGARWRSWDPGGSLHVQQLRRWVSRWFMLVSAGTFVAAAAAVDACIVQVMGAILFGLEDATAVLASADALCCACLGAGGLLCGSLISSSFISLVGSQR